MSGILSISPIVTDQQSNTASLLGVSAVARARARSAGTKNVDAEDEAASATMWDFRAQGGGPAALGRRAPRDGGEDHRGPARGQYHPLDDEDVGGEAHHVINTYA